MKAFITFTVGLLVAMMAIALTALWFDYQALVESERQECIQELSRDRPLKWMSTDDDQMVILDICNSGHPYVDIGVITLEPL